MYGAFQKKILVVFGCDCCASGLCLVPAFCFSSDDGKFAAGYQYDDPALGHSGYSDCMLVHVHPAAYSEYCHTENAFERGRVFAVLADRAYHQI